MTNVIMDEERQSHADQDRELAEAWQRALDYDLDEPAPENLASRRLLYEAYEVRFGEKVRQWRRARNWSQEDLADRLRDQGFDMHQTTVAKIERGNRPLRVAEAVAIAIIFRVPPLAVFQGPGPEELPWPIQEMQNALDSAEQVLEAMKANMEMTANMYIAQQAKVMDYANMLNQAALRAETDGAGARDGRLEDDAAEA